MAAYIKRRKKSTGTNKNLLIAITIIALTLLVVLLVWLVGQLVDAFNGGTSSTNTDKTTPSTVLSTSEQNTVEIVEKYIKELLSSKEITLRANSSSVTLNAYLAGAPVNYTELEAYMEGKGKDKALVGQYRTILATQNILEYIYDYNYIDSIVSELAAVIDKGYDTFYTVTETGVLFVRGVNHNILYSDELKAQIIEALEEYNYCAINARTGSAPYSNPDVNAIRDEIYIQEKDAYYAADEYHNTYIVPELIGRDIDVTAVADGLKNDTWEQMLYEFKAITPEILTTNVADQYFKDVLSEYTTNFDTSNINRCTNIRLASTAVNGNIILPNETFSFNRVVGERTAERGYKEALVYTDQGMEPGLGGGICQLSSTIYVAALKAGIERHTRSAHIYTVSYVSFGLDATVAWPYTDYVFRNNTGYPVKIEVIYGDGTNHNKLTVKILGTKTSNTTIRFEVTGENGASAYTVIEPTFIYISDPTVPYGEPLRDKYSYGYIVETYKIIEIDGVFVSKVKISTSKYLPCPQTVKVYVSPQEYEEIMAAQESGN